MGMVLSGAFSGSGASLALGIVMLIPAMLMSAITGLKAFGSRSRDASQKPQKLFEKLVVALGLVGAVLTLLAAACVAVVIALFAVCFAIIASSP
jgi:hypothetical protein